MTTGVAHNAGRSFPMRDGPRKPETLIEAIQIMNLPRWHDELRVFPTSNLRSPLECSPLRRFSLAGGAFLFVHRVLPASIPSSLERLSAAPLLLQ